MCVLKVPAVILILLAAILGIVFALGLPLNFIM